VAVAEPVVLDALAIELAAPPAPPGLMGFPPAPPPPPRDAASADAAPAPIDVVAVE
jgi:hypothetical protein